MGGGFFFEFFVPFSGSLFLSFFLSLPLFFLPYHDRVLERSKLHHRVRDLPAPQRRQALVQAAHPLGRDELGHPVGEAPGEPRHGLHLDLHGLEGAEADVGEELGGGRAGEEDEGLVLGGVLGADGVGVGPVGRKEGRRKGSEQKKGRGVLSWKKAEGFVAVESQWSLFSFEKKEETFWGNRTPFSASLLAFHAVLFRRRA